jgi:molecular chaperone HtpG
MKETRKFDAEVGKILNLMIHSLYTNKEIFLRELISNSSDACDKLRYLSQTDSALLGGDSEFKISISANKDAKTITIRDNGIGMNWDDLNNNLGTIAHSGTQRFMEQLSGDKKKDSQLIGQFGVGFYSCFMIADKILVTSRKAGEDKVFTWQSDGQGEYEVSQSDKEFARGTEIILHLKEGEESFLEEFKIKYIVKNYSDHIAIPIYLLNAEGQEERLNSSSAIWARNKSDITQEQYEEFYKTVSYSADKPWLTIHNRNEGTLEFTNLLFVPTNKTFDLFHPDRKSRIKLYIKRVFIADDTIDLVPSYLRFLRGVVDTDTLPLNISRETLQHNITLEKIKRSITKKVLSELKKHKDSDFSNYLQFWQNFGAALKEGLCEFNNDHEAILETCIFQSALKNQMISLDDYIASNARDDKTIYYISGDNADKLRNHPKIEGFLNNNIDVLLFTDTVDDFWVNVNSQYKDYEFKSVTRSDIDLGSADQSSAEGNKTSDAISDNHPDLQDLITFFKQELGDLIKDVKISKKLASSPACLAVEEGAMDIRMERYLIEQKQLAKASAKILEINPNHKIIQKLKSQLADQKLKEKNADLVNLLYDQACILEGEPVTDAAAFARRMNNMLS